MAPALFAPLSTLTMVAAVFNSLAVPAAEGLLLHGQSAVRTRIQPVCRKGAAVEGDVLGEAPQLVVFFLLERVPGSV